MKKFQDESRKKKEAEEEHYNAPPTWGKLRYQALTLRQPIHNPWPPTGNVGVGIRGAGLAVGIVLPLAFIDAKFGPNTSTTPHSQPGDGDSTGLRSPGNPWEAWKSTGTIRKALVSEVNVFKQDVIDWACRIDVSTCVTLAIITRVYAYERKHNGPT
jgi:hypothetical protein